MIKELRLTNWKSIKKSTLYIDPLTIIIGTNSSGKSNVLDALQFLQKMAIGKTVEDTLNEIRGGTDWAIAKGEQFSSLTIVIEDLKNNDIEYEYFIEFSKLKNNSIAVTNESLTKINSLTSTQKTIIKGNITEKYNYNIGLLSKYTSLKVEENKEIIAIRLKLSNISFLDPIPSSMRNYTKLSETLNSDASNIAGVLAGLEEIKKQEIESTITNYLSKLPENEIQKVYAEKIGKLGTDAMLYYDEKWSDKEEVLTVDTRGMSDGTLRFLGIMTALLTIKENSLLVIEEIDNGLHPSRAILLVNFLKEFGKKRNIDVICTTHNPSFLDALGTEMIAFISVIYRDKNNYSKIELLENIEELPRLLAKGKVGYLTQKGLIESTLKAN